ncbi:Molybdopterin oxidoreductase, iron-sulfur binding subunit [hydrothermal vent metagenome]|uniref:Molybdopterin oxidoreductase, iron-sulfur binding subunit n=1 Tax=hydrothermal vent metagenome TaxID=652676 RepID=A0A3B1A7E5_9ZZZZ
MSGNDINRRNFLKVMGWGGAGAALAGCDMPTTVTLEEGKETVVSYLMPEEYVIPGRGVYFASTCLQCPSGCGVQGRVREGRVLTVAGNPASPLNEGGLCVMGVASVQTHYNPDRLTKPLLRKGGSLSEVTWEEALAAIEEKVGADSSIDGNKVAWLTGTVSGHQSVLLQSLLDSFGGAKHYVYDLINSNVSEQVNKAVYGISRPTYHLTKAKAVLSFGADFLGASQSPVHFASEYAKFREAPRGVLIQVEPNMSLTGSNADLWVPAKPGTEGALAMGIAHELINSHGKSDSVLPSGLSGKIKAYDLAKVETLTGVPAEKVKKIAKTLAEKSPSLVLTGASIEATENGYAATAAANMLNVLLGNVGETITSSGGFPFPQLDAKTGSGADLLQFLDAAGKGDIDVAFFYGANPVFTAPSYVNAESTLDKIPFKVSLSQFADETTNKADLVLPLASAIEDWGTHVPAYQPEQAVISVQQPLMEKLYPATKGFGDVLLDVLKLRKVESYADFADYYAFLQDAFVALPAEFKNGVDDASFWNQTLAAGFIAVPKQNAPITANALDVAVTVPTENINYNLNMLPAIRLGMWDGRNANIPWLQESPDPITQTVWGSWAEMHPKTASRLGLVTGDFIKVESVKGDVEVPVYIHRGVFPGSVAVSVGQGHQAYGRYAEGRGINPLSILDSITDTKTGELALYGTRVKVSPAESSKKEKLIRFGGSESQVGRKLVATITAEVFNRTEGA